MDSARHKRFIRAMGACDPPTRRHAQVSRPVFAEAHACPDKSPFRSVTARPRCIVHRRNRFVRPTAFSSEAGTGSPEENPSRQKLLWGAKKEKVMKQTVTLFALSAALLISASARAADIDWKKVDAALGKTAAVSGDVHRYGLPRSDLQVSLDGVAIKPTLALGGWVAFAPMHGEAMVMGDLVLLETEITSIMTKLLDSGLDITEIHNYIPR